MAALWSFVCAWADGVSGPRVRNNPVSSSVTAASRKSDPHRARRPRLVTSCLQRAGGAGVGGGGGGGGADRSAVECGSVQQSCQHVSKSTVMSAAPPVRSAAPSGQSVLIAAMQFTTSPARASKRSHCKVVLTFGKIPVVPAQTGTQNRCHRKAGRILPFSGALDSGFRRK